MGTDYSASERSQSLPIIVACDGSLRCKWGLMRDCGVQGKAGMGMYSQFEKERDQGNFDLLPELHSILSGMKVNLSWPCTPAASQAATTTLLVYVSRVQSLACMVMLAHLQQLRLTSDT